MVKTPKLPQELLTAVQIGDKESKDQETRKTKELKIVLKQKFFCDMFDKSLIEKRNEERMIIEAEAKTKTKKPNLVLSMQLQMNQIEVQLEQIEHMALQHWKVALKEIN